MEGAYLLIGSMDCIFVVEGGAKAGAKPCQEFSLMSVDPGNIR